MINVKDLHKSFGDNEILKGIDTHVDEQEVVVVIGPSGSGKSTFLRCLNGLETATSGEIEIAGMKLTDPRTNIHQLRQHVGMVFQQFNLFKHLTILENITIGPRKVKKVAAAEADKVARELLAKVGLVGKETSYPDELSGGQQQRVAIARALAMEPRVLLYDEPTSALDPSLKQEVSRSIRRVAARGITQIVVTHDLDVARDAADIVFVLEAGRVQRSGPPNEVLTQVSAA